MGGDFMRLKDLKLNTDTNKEQFIDDLIKMVKELNLDNEETLLASHFTVMLMKKFNIGLFKVVNKYK